MLCPCYTTEMVPLSKSRPTEWKPYWLDFSHYKDMAVLRLKHASSTDHRPTMFMRRQNALKTANTALCVGRPARVTQLTEGICTGVGLLAYAKASGPSPVLGACPNREANYNFLSLFFPDRPDSSVSWTVSRADADKELSGDRLLHKIAHFPKPFLLILSCE